MAQPMPAENIFLNFLGLSRWNAMPMTWWWRARYRLNLHGTLYRNGPNQRFRPARLPPVRRRRYGARLQDRERQGGLPQPLGAHRQVEHRGTRRAGGDQRHEPL